ncbi:MAG: hypothetical protein RMK18_12295 [Armatimonadota bacterium]|nr:hypothetical protein [Armatimonadota bacterium]MDW8026626.1 hypothetical protein [Armatimonadota bacterium]
MPSWLVGAAKVDITPPLHIPELGFIPRQHKFKGVYDPLFAKALALEAKGNAVIIVTADAIGFHRNLLGREHDFIAEFRQRVHDAIGVAKEAIMLAASHAHSTPETLCLTPLARTGEAYLKLMSEFHQLQSTVGAGEVCPEDEASRFHLPLYLHEVEGASEWIEALLEKLVACAIEAWHERKRAEAFSAVGEVVGVSWSRRIIGKDGKAYRLPYRPPDEEVEREDYDPQVGLLLFRREDGDIVFVNFACHPTVVQVSDLVSADFPGALMNFVETHLSDCRICLFAQGACGDVNPVYQTTSNFADAELYGMALAGEVIKQVALLRLHYSHPERERFAQIFRRISGWRSAMLMPEIAFACKQIVLPPRHDLPDPKEAEAEYLQALAKIDGQMWWMRSERELTDEERKLGAQVRAAWDKWQVALRGRDEKERTAEVQVIALGEAALVGISGELFAAPSLHLKANSPFPFTFVIGYANGYNGYLTVRNSWSQGGYEVSMGQWALCGDGSGEIVVKHAIELLLACRSQK